MKFRNQVLKSAQITVIALLVAGAADATNIFDPSTSTNNSINGSSIRLDGTLFSDTFGANVWTINAFGGAGECLRFDVSAVTQNFDLQMVVIGPDGTTYRNDDRQAGDLRPLVFINGAINSGWYTVHIAAYAGRRVEGNFTLMYGRYAPGNANCGGSIVAEPTAPPGGQIP